MKQVLSQKNLIDKYRSIGEHKFYHFLLSSGIEKIVQMKSDDDFGMMSPELEFLECANNFLYLYRKNNEKILMDMSRIFRKAGHKLYRILLKKNMIQTNNKFLNLVSNGSY